MVIDWSVFQLFIAFIILFSVSSGCLGGAAVRRRTRDRKVACSTPGRGAIKSTIGELSLPSFRGR